MLLSIQVFMGKPMINQLLWFSPILWTWDNLSRILLVVQNIQSDSLLMNRLRSLFGSLYY